MFFLTLLVFLIILGLLIFVHEAGHFAAAKLSGVKVEEFAFGFPPRLYCRKKGETKYCINAFPVGGYCKMLGEDEDNKSPRAYSSKKTRFRFFIVVAGVIMNFFLGGILLSIGYGIGMVPISLDPNSFIDTDKTIQVLVAQVNDNSPAKTAGIEVGDRIIDFSSIDDFANFTKSNLSKQIDVKIERKGRVIDKTVNVSSNIDAPIGVGLADLPIIKLGLFESIYYGFKDMILTSKNVVVALYLIIVGIFSSGKVSEAVSGPVGIFNITGQAVKLGFIYTLQLAALLSINLAIINILPFPGLDGSRALILFLEGIFRKKVIRSEIESILHMIGFIILIGLILLVTLEDILQII